MEKIDHKKALKHLYRPSAKQPVIIDVPPLNYLMIDGQGDPSTSKDYQDAIETLYALSYNLKFMIKKAGQSDYTVLPFESLWWADDMATFAGKDKDQWKWTAMIMQPNPVTPETVAEAVAAVKRKKNPDGLSKIRFETLAEGLCAQILYFGPYADEGPTINNLHAFITERGYKLRGKHHEIYLSDFRRTAPEKLKTIIRQPVD